MPRPTRRPSESCPPDPARYLRSERSARHDDEKSYRSRRRQSSPELTHRRRESRRSTSIISNSRFSTIDEDHKDDPESEYDPRDVYYLSHPPDPKGDKDEDKSQWGLDLEAGDATPINHRDGYDEDARSTRSRGRVRRPSTIVRRPSTIGILSPRTRSPINRSRRQSMRSDYLYGTDHHRRDSVRSGRRREPHHEASDSETGVSPRTRRHRVNRSPTPPHKGSVAYGHEYSRPRPRSNTIPHHHPNYTDDEREDTYNNNPRRYHRRAHSNPPSHRHHLQSRRPSLNLATLKSSPKTASLLKAASRALEAGAATVLKLRKESPSTPLFSAQSGSKIAAAALGAAVVDGLIEHEHRRHPKLMRKGGLRHHVVKQVVQRGVVGLVGGILEEGLTGGSGSGDHRKGDGGNEGRGGKGRRKESVKRVAKGMVRDYERWEKGGGKGDEGKGTGKEGNEGKGERERGRRGSERERDTDGEGRRERTRERESERERSVRGRRR